MASAYERYDQQPSTTGAAMMPLTLPRPSPDESPDETSGQPADFRLDPDTMTATVREQWMPLVRLATLLLNDRAVAEEVVQEACEAVWRRRPDVTSRAQLGAYLRTSVVNGSRTVGRRRGTAARHLSLIRAEHDLTDVPADAALLVREDRREIREAVSCLPDRQREVLVLRYWARLSEAEIAHTLDISTGTVKSTAHHALAALRSRLRAHPEGQS